MSTSIHSDFAPRQRAAADLYAHPAIDLLFALTLASLFLGVEPTAGGVKLPPALVGSVLIGALFVPRILSPVAWRTLFSPALFIYFAIFLASALSNSIGLFVTKTAQLFATMAVIGPFVLHYSQRPMERFNRYFVTACCAILVYCIIWHVSHGFMVGWKRLDEPKTIFTLLPFFCAAVALGGRSRIWVVGFFALSALLILASGERKAYAALVLAIPFVFPLSRPSTYLAPGLMMIALISFASFDGSGYVERQINSIEARLQGQYSETLSDQRRAWTDRLAADQFREKPLLGIGTGGFYNMLTRTYRGRTALDDATAIHGEFIRVSTENGIVGLLAFLSLIATSMTTALRRQARDGRPRPLQERSLALALVLTLVIYVAFESYDTVLTFALCLMPYVGRLQLHPWRARNDIKSAAPPA